MDKAVFGIDLGTTNSCIARYTDEGPRVLSIDGQKTVPSVVAHDGEELLVGVRALNYSRIRPERAVSSIKRRMGDTGYRHELGGVARSPVEISALILGYLREEGGKAAGGAVEDVVITVPAWFTDEQRQATVAAGKAAGLNVLRIINEPTAAALAYSHPGRDEKSIRKWVVYDLGGGTFDVSVLAVSEGMKEVLSSCGNSFLGGDDFDHAIAEFLLAEIKDRYNADPGVDAAFMARLKHVAEEAKIVLSTEPVAHIREILKSADRTFELEVELSRARFEEMIEHHIDSTIEKTRQALDEARVGIDEIDELLLVGGSTRIPIVAERLEALFGRAPSGYIDPDLSVALGATVQAGILAGLELMEIVVDVAPHTLGIAALGLEDDGPASLLEPVIGKDGRPHPRTFVPLIRKNSKLPARFTKVFHKIDPDQDRALIPVYQGEAHVTWENNFIGSFSAPLSNHEEESLYVTFEYDANGTVKVELREASESAPAKRYTMDLSRTAEENSERWSFSEVEEDEPAAEEQGPSAAFDASVSNFLVQRVEREIEKRKISDGDRVVDLLGRYKSLLLEGDDEAMDTVEDELYGWLEADSSEG